MNIVQHNLSLRLKEVFFCTRVTSAWNSLPESVISASTTDSFKNKLDKFWSNQALIYDYKAELTGIGDRSFTRTLIDNIQGGPKKPDCSLTVCNSRIC